MRTAAIAASLLGLIAFVAGCGEGDGGMDNAGTNAGTEAGENRGESGVISESTHDGTGDPAGQVNPGAGTTGESSGTADASGTIGSGVDAEGGGPTGVAEPRGEAAAGGANANPVTEDGAGSDPGDN